MRSSVRLAALLLLLVPLGSEAAAPRYRLGVGPFTAPEDVLEGERKLLAALVQDAFRRDGRMRVVEPDYTQILRRVSPAHRLPGAVDSTTVPRVGKLAAPNYHLTGEVLDSRDGRSLLLQIWDLEVGALSSAVRLLPSTEEQRRQVLDSMVSDLLVFVPRFDTASAEGTVTITIDGGVPARVKFYPDAEWRKLPARSPKMPPGLQAAAIEPDDPVYVPRVEFFRVHPNGDTTHAIRLEKRKIDITLRDVPPNAAVFVDDAFVSDPHAPVTLEAGPHELFLLASDGSIQRRRFEAGLHHPLSLSLASATGEQALEATVRRIADIGDVKPLGVAIHGRDVVIVTPDAIIAVDPLSATKRWTNLSGGNSGPPVIAGGALFVPRSYYASFERSRGRGETRTYYERRAALRQIDLESGEETRTVLDRVLRLDILDATEEHVLVAADGALHVFGRTPAFTRLGSAPHEIDLNTARFGGEGLVMLDRDRQHVVSFFPDGQFAWVDAIDGKVARLFTAGGDIIVQTEEKTVARLTRTGARKRAPAIDKAIAFAVDGGDALLALASDGTLYTIAEEGGVTRHQIPIGDLRVLTACRAEPSGRLVLVAADHRVALFNPASMQVEWHHDFEERVLMVPSARGMTVVATESNVALFGSSARQRIVGWIERVATEESAVDVRLSAPVGVQERLAAARFADYRARRTDAALAAIEPSRIEQHGGVTRLHVRSTEGIRVGDVLSRGGMLRIDVPELDALVWVDESFECRGSCVVTGLDRGSHEVVVAKGGFERWTQQVTIADAPRAIAPRLQALPDARYLHVRTRPAGADVTVEGDRLARTEDDRASRWMNRDRQERVNVTVSKPGYLTIQRQVRNDLQTTLDVPLSFAPPWFRLSTGWATASATELLGWPEAAIAKSGVTGPPLRERAEIPASARAEGAWTFGRVSPFAVGEWHGAGVRMTYGAGLRMLVNRNVPWLGELSIEAAGYVAPADKSHAPTEQRGQGTVSMPDRPLEEWSHPIRNVLVDNSGPEQFELAMLVRPRVHSFVRLSAGALRGMRLRGTALVHDPASGHLVRDRERSYDYTMQDGWYGTIEAHLGADVLLPFLRVRNGYALFARYERRQFSLGPLTESSDEVMAGVSYTLYQSGARR